jgi:hypothetical protein
MSGAVIGSLGHWHDFYILVGTAGATLLGLTCVAASIGASYFRPEHEKALQAFLTPTAFHFAAVLFVAILAVAPFADAGALGTSLFALGAIGTVYSSWVWLNVRAGSFAATVILIDRVWYGLAPVVAYGVIAAASVAVALDLGRSLAALACGLGFLMIAALRNGWDMTMWILTRPPPQND